MNAVQLVAFAIAVIICTAAAAACVGYLLRTERADRLLLWFGLFAAIYGGRMFFKQPLAAALGVDRATAGWLENVLSYFILVPALLFVEELYGQGWHRLLRRLTQATAAYALVALVVDIAVHRPDRMPDPSNIWFLLLGLIILIGVRTGYRPPRFPEWRLLLTGLLIFVLFVLNEHAVGARLVPWRFTAEPIGFLINLGCLGYIALTRFFTRGRQLAAVDQEMRSAREIQTSILPHDIPAVAGVQLAARYAPLAAVAGDFYDIVPLGNGDLALLVADVSGHGVPAALIASMVKVSFAASIAETDDPGTVLQRMNRTLCGMFERSFVTAACAVLRPRMSAISYALAGHPPPLLQADARGRTQLLDERGIFLGMMPSAKYVTQTVSVGAGARLILYSDGITETQGAGDDLFGVERLQSFADAERGHPVQAFADALLASLRTFAGRGSLAHDDITLVVADIVGGGV